MKKYLTWVIMICFIVSTIFIGSACKTETTAEETVEEAVEETATEETEEKEEEKEEEVVEKNFEGMELNVFLPAVQVNECLPPLVSEFEEKFGVKVTFDSLGSEEYIQKAALELASGADAHDAFYCMGGSMGQWAAKNWMEPLDEYINGMSEEEAQEYDISDILEGSLNGGNFGGVQYGLPTFSAAVLMYFRIDYLEQAGIESPPTTWEELEEACKKLADIGIPGIAMRGQQGMYGNLWHFPMILYGYGGHYFANYPDDLHPAVNTPVWIDSVERFARLMTEYGPSGVESFYYEDIALAVQQGDVGIWIDGAPLIAVYNDPEVSESNGKIGFSICPAGPEGAYPPNISHYWTMNPNSKKKELAWEFIRWATSKEILLAEATGDYDNPLIANSRSSVFSDSTFIQQNDYDYGYGTWAQAFSDSLAIADPTYIPPIEEFPEMAEIISAAISSVMAGSSAEEELDEAQQLIDDILSESGRY